MEKRGQKRGQLTLFIFMGIVIVIAILAFSFFNFDSLDSGTLDSEARIVYDAVDFCMQDVTAKAILDLGISGGYFDLPEKSNNIYMPYYFYLGENLMPSLETVEEEFAKYVKQIATVCSKKAFFNLASYDIVASEMNVEAKVNSDDTVSFSISYPMSVTKGENSYYLNEEFLYSYEARLYSMYNLASSIISEHDIESRALCINCAGDLAYEMNLFLDLWQYSPTEMVFYVSDDTSIVDNENLVFFFVIKYPENNNFDPYENFKF